MKKKNKSPAPLFSAETKQPATDAFRMRLAAGKYAVSAAEAEVCLDGSRIAGGNGSFEFDLFAEAWVDIRIIRSS